MRTMKRRQGGSALFGFVTMCGCGFLWVGCGTESPIVTSESSRTSDPIINGTPTTGYRNAVSIRVNDSHWCSGYVVGYNTVLTALHCDCLLEAGRSSYRFRSGPSTDDGQDLAANNSVVKVTDVFKPYNCQQNANNGGGTDVMLLVTEPPIGEASSIDRGPTYQRPLYDYSPGADDEFTIVGYGRTELNQTSSPGLKRTGLQQLDDVQGVQGEIINTEPTSANQEPASGDSGAPVFLNGTNLVAVHSSGVTGSGLAENTRFNAIRPRLEGVQALLADQVVAISTEQTRTLCFAAQPSFGATELNNCTTTDGYQNWQFIRATGEIKNLESGQCLDSWGRIGPARMNGCHGLGGNQHWEINLEWGEIKNPSSGLCLDAYDGGPGDIVQMNTCWGVGGNQRWHFF